MEAAVRVSALLVLEIIEGFSKRPLIQKISKIRSIKNNIVREERDVVLIVFQLSIDNRQWTSQGDRSDLTR